MMMTNYKLKVWSFLAGSVMLFSLSCKLENPKPGQVLVTSSSTSLIDLVKKDPQYSILYTALVSAQLADPLGVYGKMTLLAPTDDAFKKYFKRKGISDLSKVNPDSLKSLLKYHIYNEQYGSAFFAMGTLPTPTINGNYIRFDISAGLSKTVLNGSVTFNQLDVLGSNGILHSLNDVLDPPVLNLYDWLKSRPEYSIMLEAFDKTANSDAILKKTETDPAVIRYGQPQVKWKTLFLETNAVLAKVGINSFDDLAKKYSDSYKTTKSYASLTDSLNLFVRFHALDLKFFISDFGDVFKETFAPGNYLIFNSTGGLTINRRTDDVTGQQASVGVDIPNSNNLASNGIVNSVSSVLNIYKVKPITVIQKFAGEPADRVIILPNGTISDFATQFSLYPNDPTNQALFKWIKWGYPVGTKSQVTVHNNEWLGDLTVNFTGVTQGFWVELTTPLIFTGNYNVFLNYSGLRRSVPANVSYSSFTFDGQQLGSLVAVNMNDNLDANGGSTAGVTIPGVTLYLDNQYRRFIGKVSLTKAATHVFRMDALPYAATPGYDSMVWYSIELVPVP